MCSYCCSVPFIIGTLCCIVIVFVPFVILLLLVAIVGQKCVTFLLMYSFCNCASLFILSFGMALCSFLLLGHPVFVMFLLMWCGIVFLSTLFGSFCHSHCVPFVVAYCHCYILLVLCSIVLIFASFGPFHHCVIVLLSSF